MLDSTSSNANNYHNYYNAKPHMFEWLYFNFLSHGMLSYKSIYIVAFLFKLNVGIAIKTVNFTCNKYKLD